jgi:hypothetical protein
MVVQTAFVFWHTSTIPKLQIPVFPPNPRLAKLSIAAVELIDGVDVHHGRGAGLRRNGDRMRFSVTVGGMFKGEWKPSENKGNLPRDHI